MSAQDQTIDQYQELMKLNAVSHLLRSAQQVGLLEGLRSGQKTLEQLCDQLSLMPKPTGLLLAALVKIGVIEKYEDDFALAAIAQLLCQYDSDLGDRRWQDLPKQLRGDEPIQVDDQAHFDAIAATQWIHTPAAIQAAEILDIGGFDVGESTDLFDSTTPEANPSPGSNAPSEGNDSKLEILDLGCGSAVWSCAMAFRDIRAAVTAVDNEPALVAARKTADSIGLLSRFTGIPGQICLSGESSEDSTSPISTVVTEGDAGDWFEKRYDIVVLAQRLHAEDDTNALKLLRLATSLTQPGGRVVVIDLFRGPGEPSLADRVEELRLELETKAGRVRDLKESSLQATTAGLEHIQFTFLAASRTNLGMLVGVKPLS